VPRGQNEDVARIQEIRRVRTRTEESHPRRETERFGGCFQGGALGALAPDPQRGLESLRRESRQRLEQHVDPLAPHERGQHQETRRLGTDSFRGAHRVTSSLGLQ
jgi:hypothetical protein